VRVRRYSRKYSNTRPPCCVIILVTTAPGHQKWNCKLP